MMRKVILASMLAFTILLSTSPLYFKAIGDGAGSENYVVLENGTNIIYTNKYIEQPARCYQSDGSRNY